MMTRGTSTAISLLARALTGALLLVLAAPPADAQSASSARASGVDGTLSAGAAVKVDPTSEDVHCNGDVKIETKAVSDPTTPPGVVVSIDATALACVGQGTGSRYVSDSHTSLTRLLAANDVITTTLALHRSTPNGFLSARTAQLTLNLSYDTTTGVLTGATASLGDFVP